MLFWLYHKPCGHFCYRTPHKPPLACLCLCLGTKKAGVPRADSLCAVIEFERCKGSNNFRYGKIFFENNLQTTEKQYKKFCSPYR